MVFIRSTVSRAPVYIDDVDTYKACLFSANSLALYTDNAANLELEQFMRLIENSYNYETQPEPKDIRRFLDYAIMLWEKASDENNWRSGIQACVDMWLASINSKASRARQRSI